MPLPIGRAEWIILDTSVVRGLVQREVDSIDLGQVAAFRGRHPIGVADAATAELLYWLRGAPLETLRELPRILEPLSRLLDREFPLTPGGAEIAAFAGLVSYPAGENRRDSSAHSKAVWQHISGIASREDVEREVKFRNSVSDEAVLTARSPDPVLKGFEDTWIGYTISAITKELRETGQAVTAEPVQRVETRIREKLAAGFGLSADDPAIDRLELYLQHMLRWIRIASAPGYTPPTRRSSNNAVDMTLLFYMLVPAVVCTADVKFINSVRSLQSPDRLRVMSPTELVVWLRTGGLPAHSGHGGR